MLMVLLFLLPFCSTSLLQTYVYCIYQSIIILDRHMQHHLHLINYDAIFMKRQTAHLSCHLVFSERRSSEWSSKWTLAHWRKCLHGRLIPLLCWANRFGEHARFLSIFFTIQSFRASPGIIKNDTYIFDIYQQELQFCEFFFLK